jgi:hypothetical protein
VNTEQKVSIGTAGAPTAAERSPPLGRAHYDRSTPRYFPSSKPEAAEPGSIRMPVPPGSILIAAVKRSRFCWRNSSTRAHGAQPYPCCPLRHR